MYPPQGMMAAMAKLLRVGRGKAVQKMLPIMRVASRYRVWIIKPLLHRDYCKSKQDSHTLGTGLLLFDTMILSLLQ